MSAHRPLRVIPGLDPGIHEAAQQRKPYGYGASSWIAGSRPGNDEREGVDLLRNDPESFAHNDTTTNVSGVPPHDIHFQQNIASALFFFRAAANCATNFGSLNLARSSSALARCRLSDCCRFAFRSPGLAARRSMNSTS